MKPTFFQRSFFATLIITVLLIGASSVQAQQVPIKIAFIDLQAIFKNSTTFQTVYKDIEQTMNTKSNRLEQMKEDLEEKFKKFTLQRELLPSETVQQKEQQLRAEREEFFKTYEDEKQDIEQVKARKLEPLIQALQTAVEEIAKEEGYTMIFKRAYLAYGDPRLDITSKLIAKIDQ